MLEAARKSVARGRSRKMFMQTIQGDQFAVGPSSRQVEIFECNSTAGRAQVRF
jgi:hypothetical protein